jgi:hypothetical protein
MRWHFSRIKRIFVPCAENNYFPNILDKRLLSYVFLLFLFLKLLILPLHLLISKSSFFAEITQIALLEYLNSERRSKKLPPLVLNEQLSQSAYLKAKDMLEKGYFSHFSPEGLSPWYWFKLSAYDFKYAGENLAIGFLDSREVHNAWMNSVSHRQNILNPNYREVGIAVLRGKFNGNEVYIVVQHFGTPKRTIAQESSQGLKYKPNLPQSSPQKTIPPSLTPMPTAVLNASLEPKKSTPLGIGTTTEKELKDKTSLKFLSEENIKNPVSDLSKFIILKYNLTINRIIYILLAAIILSLSLAIYYDVFVYRKFIIDYKGLIPTWLIFSFMLLMFIFIDQVDLVKIIPHDFRIYGAQIF